MGYDGQSHVGNFGTFGWERRVVVSADEYRRLKRRAREVLAVEALSDADLEAIARTEMAPHHKQFDLELK
jgi:hypothetical protein